MINSIHILGRVGKKDCKTLQSGKTVANLSVATSKKFTNQAGEKQEKTTWHNVTVFSKLAEIVQQYVEVGDLLYVDGEIDNQKYTGQDGIEKYKTVILGNQVKLLPKQQKANAAPPAPPVNQSQPFELNDDVPF